MTIKAQSDVGIYSAEQGLPGSLLHWLNEHKSHDIFSDPQWYQALIEFKQQHEAPLGIKFYWFFVLSNDSPVVAAPIEVKNNKIKFVANFYSPCSELFYDRETLNVRQAWALLLSHLTYLRPGWLSFEMFPLFPEQLSRFKAIALELPVTVFNYNFSANYCSDFKDFRTYWNSRSSRLRNTHRRRTKQARQHQLEFQIHDVCTPELEADYWYIYQHSWKIQEPSRCFIHWLMNWAGEHKILKLGLLKIDGKPAAFQLWLVNGKCGSIFKLAQDKRFDALSPGTILMEHMVRQLSQNSGITKIDFLLGNDEFKALWMDDKVLVSGAEIINRSHVKGRLLSMMYTIKNWLKGMNRNTRNGDKYD